MGRWRAAIREITLLELADIDGPYTAFRLSRITQFHHLESRRDDMAGHIAQCAGTVVPPSTPIEGDEVIHKILIGGCTQPKVPVQFSRYGDLHIGPLYTLRPYGPVSETIYFRHIPDRACAIPVDQLPDPV